MSSHDNNNINKKITTKCPSNQSNGSSIGRVVQFGVGEIVHKAGSVVEWVPVDLTGLGGCEESFKEVWFVLELRVCRDAQQSIQHFHSRSNLVSFNSWVKHASLCWDTGANSQLFFLLF